ncbi:MAG: hypothetical protein EOM92_18775 [Gammaproteobacteria bacterium]|nr:hypothetical protein [Gammaproteobacteria bacterium]
MKRNTARRRIDRLFTAAACAAVAVMAFFLLLVVAPVFVNGAGAYVFRGTVEFRKMMLDQFGRGDATAVKAEALPGYGSGRCSGHESRRGCAQRQGGGQGTASQEGGQQRTHDISP